MIPQPDSAGLQRELVELRRGIAADIERMSVGWRALDELERERRDLVDSYVKEARERHRSGRRVAEWAYAPLVGVSLVLLSGTVASLVGGAPGAVGGVAAALTALGVLAALFRGLADLGPVSAEWSGSRVVVGRSEDQIELSLSPRQEIALETAAREYGWSSADRKRLVHLADALLASGVNRMPLTSPEDWRRIHEDAEGAGHQRRGADE